MEILLDKQQASINELDA
jgi:hypothetical protein